MMDSCGIFKQANDLVFQCGTRNPERITDSLGIIIVYEDSLKNLLGMYTYRWRHRIMVLNPRLEDNLKQMVIAHELGHDQRHRDIAKAGNTLREFSLFCMKDVTEYEANAFAAHILLDNEEVLSLVREGYDAFTVARVLNVDVNLLLIKMQEMNRLGYDFKTDLDHDSRFFRRITG